MPLFRPEFRRGVERTIRRLVRLHHSLGNSTDRMRAEIPPVAVEAAEQAFPRDDVQRSELIEFAREVMEDEIARIKAGPVTLD